MSISDSSNRLIDEMLSHLKPPRPIVDQHPESKVTKFYENRSILITGATGFIGRALVEKFIRSCEKIKRVYILIREKRNQSIHERLANYIKSPVSATAGI
jgi:fatty acyl-CoA reductase